jgi:putative peptidoglycan lipid II flippase
MSLGITILPYFTKKVSIGEKYSTTEYNRLLVLLFIGSLVLCLIFACFSYNIVQLLFSRGKTEQTELMIISNLQMIYLIQIPFYLLAIIAIRLLTALNRNIQSLYGSIVSMILIFLFNYIFEVPFGIYGIALATLGATFFNMLVNVWFSIKNLKQRNLV